MAVKNKCKSTRNFIQILGELCVTLKFSADVVNAWFAEPEMVYELTVSLGYWGFGVWGERSELYCVITGGFFSDIEGASAFGKRKES